VKSLAKMPLGLILLVVLVPLWLLMQPLILLLREDKR
jgi:hypothetical protein